MEEIWKPVVGDNDFYEVSNTGRVKSLDRIDSHGQKRIGVVLKYLFDGSGYPFVKLSKNGKAKAEKVHHLVLEAFVGPCPEGMECRHLDGNPQNSHLSNLRWGTPKENYQDRKLHGTDADGERNGGSKLIEEQVREIRKDIGVRNNPKLVEKYGVSISTIWKIKNNKTWLAVN